MIRIAAFAAALLAAGPALSQDAQKFGCVPDTMTRCETDGKCETRTATDRDKNEVLVLDFAEKKVSVRRSGEVRPFGDILDEKSEDGKRAFKIRRGGGGDKLMFLTLDAAGKLEGDRPDDRIKFTATCTPAS